MKKKCIIVDGPDCTGKTTLCQKLSEIYNIPIYHLTYYSDREKHENQFKVAEKMLNDWAFCDNENNGFILDRYILSEIAYRNVYRLDMPLISGIDSYIRNLESLINHQSIELFITLPKNKEKWLEAFKIAEQTRDEMYSSEKISLVYDEYLKLWEFLRYNRNVWRYDMFENMNADFKNKTIQL